MSNEAVDLVKRARANWDDCMKLGDFQYPFEGDGRRLTPYVCDCLLYAAHQDQRALYRRLRDIVQMRLGEEVESAAQIVFPDVPWFEVDNYCPEMIEFRNELWEMLIAAAGAMDEGDL